MIIKKNHYITKLLFHQYKYKLNPPAQNKNFQTIINGMITHYIEHRMGRSVSHKINGRITHENDFRLK